jgi:hypothetical protein
MKNVKTYIEFINEAFAKTAGDLVMDYDPDPDTLVNIKLTAKALGINPNSLKQIDSEMDEGSPEYDAAEKAFLKGKAEELKLPDASLSGPFVYVNKGTGVAKYEEQGFTAYFFSDKSKF